MLATWIGRHHRTHTARDALRLCSESRPPPYNCADNKQPCLSSQSQTKLRPGLTTYPSCVSSILRCRDMLFSCLRDSALCRDLSGIDSTDPDVRAALVNAVRDACINVGFLYSMSSIRVLEPMRLQCMLLQSRTTASPNRSPPPLSPRRNPSSLYP